MRDLLLSEVQRNDVLLHGSPRKIHQLLPHFTDEEVAICATPYPEIAIFMAVAGACKQGRYGYSVTPHKNGVMSLVFTLCKEKVTSLLKEKPSGFIYAIDNKPFKKFDIVEYRAYVPLYVSKSFEVTTASLPFTLLEGETVYKVFTRKLTLE